MITITSWSLMSQLWSQCHVTQQKGDIIYYKDDNDFIYINS